MRTLAAAIAGLNARLVDSVSSPAAAAAVPQHQHRGGLVVMALVELVVGVVALP
jgi:hypothetical protein